MNPKNKNQTKIFATIALILILTIATLMTTMPAVLGQTTKTQSRGFVNVAPKIAGLGDSVVINAWTSPTPPLISGAAGASGYGIGQPRYNYTYTFTRPDGTQDVVVGGPSFGEGSAWLFYKPSAVGNWSVTLYWPGDANFTDCTSPPFNFEVRTTSPYTYAADIPLPTGYWTRPINGENRLWYQISGDWRQASYDSSYSKYNQYSQAPATSHILWVMSQTDANWVGGLIGGTEYSMEISSASERSSLSVGRVANGRAYMVRPDGTHCFDVKTGETLWVKTMPLGTFAVTPTFDWLQNMPDAAGGEQPYANIYNYVSTTVNGTPMVQVWDIWQGAIYKNITGPNAGFNSFDEVHGYFYRYNAGQLIKWDPNIQQGMGGLGTTTGTNFTQLIVWNVTGIPAAPRHFVDDVGIVVSGGKLYRINLDDGSFTAYNTTAPSNTVLDATTGTLFGGGTTGGLTMNYTAWDLYGNQKWISEESQYPFGWFWSYGGFSSTPGLFHYAGYDGHLYAWNATTGRIQWAFYDGDSGLDTPTNTWTFWNNIVSAGAPGNVIVYAGNGEHTPAQPAWRGQRLYGVDGNTGEEVWHIAFSSLDKCIADGVLMAANYYDGLMYGFSLGPTSTTVSVSPKVTATGTSVLIEGTVMDQSPAQPNTPAVSDDSMTGMMEYLHMQKPLPDNITGVPVHLYATDANGKTTDIGTVTSDMSGLFKKLWQPTEAGEYTIYACFDGSKAYDSSYATTAVGITTASAQPQVSPATSPATSPQATIAQPTAPTGSSPQPVITPGTTPTNTTPITESPTNIALIAAAAAVIVIIAAAAIAITLKRKK
jgi:hypothetical protein